MINLPASKIGSNLPNMRSNLKLVFGIFLSGLSILLLSSCGDSSGSSPGGPPSSYRGPVKLGIDVLEESRFAALRGKRVGLITNQTSVNRRGTKTRLVLHRAKEVNLTALFTPEHGLDGKEKAGNKVATRKDPLTGLTAFSLYGNTRKPTSAMLRHIDVMLFDLQDIGARSYTYISTMVLAMEACGESGKEFIVLDRPNPIGGIRVQGPPIQEKWRSFVGQLPVPYLHGMTAGELARMSNEKGWMKRKCKLTVIPMHGWRRSMAWEHTGLRWVPTSPNIPNARSPFYYAATGIFGELKIGDVGIGTNYAFEVAGGWNVDPNKFTNNVRRANTPGVTFAPYTNPKKPNFRGTRMKIATNATAELPALNIMLIHEMGLPVSKVFASADKDKWKVFYKVYGSEDLKTAMQRGVPPGKIIASWKSHNDRFKSQRKRYLMYP